MSQSPESQRACREYYKIHKKCVRCHKQDAYTLNGRSYCYECAEKDREYSKIRYQRGKEHKKQREQELNQERISKGLCPRCGRPQDDGGKVMCSRCRYRKREIRRRNEPDTHLTIQDKHARSYDGYCYHCGAPVKEGLTLNHKPYRVCEKCYENILKAGEKGRAAEHLMYDFAGFWRGGVPIPRRVNE